MYWQNLEGNWVLVPPKPIAIIHFLGGAFVASAPHMTYRWLLEKLAEAGYVIIATPFINTMNHHDIARQCLWKLDEALTDLNSYALRRKDLPIYGLGHSMGCKLHVLIGSLSRSDRAGNILMSYNNFSARRSIPLMDQMSPLIDQFKPLLGQWMINPETAIATEFIPSPAETMQLVQERYRIDRNLMIKFRNDDLDETRALTEALRLRFPEMIDVQILQGNHLTPMGQDIGWQPGTEFSPWDAVGQFMRQGLYRDLNVLQATILQWLQHPVVATTP